MGVMSISADTPSAIGVDRRPLASRRWRVMHVLARNVARTGITPNMVSVAGMIVGMAAGVALWGTSRVDPAGWEARMLFIAAAVCVQFRLVCNLIDGMVAVEGGKRSAVGEIYNEAPDRVSDAATLIGAGYALGSSPVLGYAAACMAIFLAYVRALGKGCGMASDYCGPMAKQQRMFVVTVAAVLMAALPARWRVFGPALDAADAGIMFIGLVVILAGGVVTAVRRFSHLAAFLRTRGTN